MNDNQMRAFLAVSMVLFLGAVFVGFATYFKIYGASYTAYGTYERITKTIKINARDMSLEDVQETFYHEFAHHFWYNALAAEERAAFEKLHNKRSGESLKEDFAYSYEAYLTGYHVSKEREEYFDNITKAHCRMTQAVVTICEERTGETE